MREHRSVDTHDDTEGNVDAIARRPSRQNSHWRHWDLLLPHERVHSAHRTALRRRTLTEDVLPLFEQPMDGVALMLCFKGRERGDTLQ